MDIEEFNGLPEEVRKDAEKLGHLIKLRLASWAAMGYEYLDARVEEGDLLPALVRYRLVRQSPRQEIVFTFSPFRFSGERKDRFSCLVFRDLETSHGMHSADLKPARYFQECVPSFDEASIEMENYAGTFEECADRILAAYKYYMEEHLSGVLAGEEWVEGYGVEWT